MVYKIKSDGKPIPELIDQLLKEDHIVKLFLVSGQTIDIDPACKVRVINEDILEVIDEVDEIISRFKIDSIMGVMR